MGIIRKINQLLGNFVTPKGVIVLTYHRINDKIANDNLVVHPKKFSKQMFFLSFYRRQFRVIGIEEMMEYLSSERTIDSGETGTKILITFDDGYRDNYLYAWPILKRYRFPAVIFLTAKYIGSEYKKERFKSLPWRRDYLNREEIREMVKGGISFGAHTMTHPHLLQIPLEEVEKEIKESKTVVSELTSKPTEAFCYPYGEYNTSIVELVKKSGFKCAFSVTPGVNYPGEDVFQIKRIDVLGHDNFSSFKYKITEKYISTF